MFARAATGFWLREVQVVTVDVQDHVADGVANSRVRVRGGIIEQTPGFVICFLGALGLGCSDGTKGDKHGDVNGHLIIEESPEDLLNKAGGIWRKRGGFFEISRVLDFGAIGGLRPGVGSILSAFGWVCWNLCSDSSM